MARQKIDLEEFDKYFEYDDKTDRLFWKNELIQTDSVLSLSKVQNTFVIIASIAAIFSALASVCNVGLVFCNNNLKCPLWLQGPTDQQDKAASSASGASQMQQQSQSPSPTPASPPAVTSKPAQSAPVRGSSGENEQPTSD